VIDVVDMSRYRIRGEATFDEGYGTFRARLSRDGSSGWGGNVGGAGVVATVEGGAAEAGTGPAAGVDCTGSFRLSTSPSSASLGCPSPVARTTPRLRGVLDPLTARCTANTVNTPAPQHSNRITLIVRIEGMACALALLQSCAKRWCSG
jgi:hypothetical protein